MTAISAEKISITIKDGVLQKLLLMVISNHGPIVLMMSQTNVI